MDNVLIKIGVIIYVLVTGIDKFVMPIPNMLYIPAAIIGIVCILAGAFESKRVKG